MLKISGSGFINTQNQQNQFGGQQPNQYGGQQPNQFGGQQPNQFGGQIPPVNPIPQSLSILNPQFGQQPPPNVYNPIQPPIQPNLFVNPVQPPLYPPNNNQWGNMPPPMNNQFGNQAYNNASGMNGMQAFMNPNQNFNQRPY